MTSEITTFEIYNNKIMMTETDAPRYGGYKVEINGSILDRSDLRPFICRSDALEAILQFLEKQASLGWQIMEKNSEAQINHDL